MDQTTYDMKCVQLHLVVFLNKTKAERDHGLAWDHDRMTGLTAPHIVPMFISPSLQLQGNTGLY